MGIFEKLRLREKVRNATISQEELQKVIENNPTSDDVVNLLQKSETHCKYLYDALSRDKTFVEKAFPLAEKFYRNAGDDGRASDICRRMISPMIQSNPDIADKFITLLPNERVYMNERRWVNSIIAEESMKVKPELAPLLMKTDIGRIAVAEAGDYKTYLDYMLKNPQVLQGGIASPDNADYRIADACREQNFDIGKQCLHILRGLESYPELMEKGVKTLSFASKKGQKELGNLLMSRYQKIPLSFLTMAKKYNGLILESNDCENKLLHVLDKMTKECPEKSDEINRFIVDKFCRDEATLYGKDVYCNDLIVMSNALVETAKSGYVSKSDSKKYMETIKTTKYKTIDYDTRVQITPDIYNATDEELENLEDYEKTLRDALKGNLGKLQNLLSEKQPEQEKASQSSKESSGKNGIQLEKVKNRLDKARKSVSGVVAADKIAEEIKAGNIVAVTPEKGKTLCAKYNKQKFMGD